MNQNLGKWIAVVLALALLGAACGGDTEDAETSFGGDTDAAETEASDDEAAFAQRDEAVLDEASDAAEEVVEEAADTSADAMGDDAVEDAAELTGSEDRSRASGTTTTMASGDAADAAGGFFAPEEPEPAAVVAQDYGVRPFVETDRDPVSTFALDVDTGSYTLARRLIENGQYPDRDAVRVEEFVNSFSYDYDAPNSGLAIQADGGPSPFDDNNVIVRVGVQAEEVSDDERPPAALTFVVDTSGSMDRTDRLGLVKSSLSGLVGELNDDDTVAIVTYSDGADVILPPTEVDQRGEILDAIDALRPGGSTNLEAGLVRGYELANEAFQRSGINRVVLASDGIANVGLTDPNGLSRRIRDDADEGIQLVAVGVGLDGFNDVLMEQLADNGDGFYAYVDTIDEAARLFRDDLVGTLLTVALDGKIQVEFNPETVAQYRLIGFENRGVLDDDFRNDSVDAGELGAGHQVTALYELTLRDGGFGGFGSDDDLGTVRLRWEDPSDGSVDETSLPLDPSVLEQRWGSTSDDFRLAVTVAAWAELLRQSPYTGEVSTDQVLREAETLADRDGTLDELVGLVAATR